MRTDKEISELLELHYGIPTDPNLVEELRSCYVTPETINCTVCDKPFGDKLSLFKHFYNNHTNIQS